MNKLSNILEMCGLQITKEYSTKEFDFVQCSYLVDELNVAEYLIMPCIAEQFEIISSSEKKFLSFQKEVIEPVYFSLRGDLRWNLYFVFIFDSEQFALIPDQLKDFVQRDKSYARKLVLNVEQIRDSLPVASIPNGDKVVAPPDPIEEWFNQLEPKGLSFCLEAFSNRNAEKFIADGILKSEVVTESYRDQPNNELSNEILKIERIDMGEGYRSYCFNPGTMLNFKTVNILEGTNGSGKTSILEAIELAFTGELEREKRGSKMTGKDPKQEWNGKLTLSNGETFQGELLPKQRKKLEGVFYQNRQKRFDKLNRLFHQYNYFSSDATYQFSFNTDEKLNYKAEFGRIVFGEEAKSIQDNWERYLKAFHEELPKPLHERKTNLHNQIRMIDDLIKEQMGSFTNIKLIRDLLKECQIDYKTSVNPRNIDSVLEWLQDLGSQTVKIDAIRSTIEEAVETGIDSIEVLLDEEFRCTEELKNQKNLVAETTTNIKKLEKSIQKIRALISQNTTLQKQYESINKQNRRLQNLIRNQDKVVVRQGIDEQISGLQAQLDIYERIYERYETLLQDQSSFPKGEIAVLKEKLLKKKSSLQFKLDSVQTQIKSAEQTSSISQTTQSEIKALGKKYIETLPEVSICPLCGTNHFEAQKLSERINFSQSSEEYDLSELLEQKEKLIVKFNMVEHELLRVREFEESLDLLGYKEQVSKLTMKQCWEKLSLNLNERDQLKSTKSLLESTKIILEKEGFTLANIEDLDEFFNMLTLTELISNDDLYTSADLVNRIDKESRALVLEIKKKISDLSYSLKESQEAVIEFEKLLKNEDNIYKMMEAKRKKIFKWKLAVNKLAETNVNIEKTTSFMYWSNCLTKLMKEIELQQKKGIDSKVLKESKAQLIELKNDIKETRIKLNRCRMAAKELSQLAPITEYSNSFIEKNIKKISDLFFALHSPREFTVLGLDKSGNLQALREKTNYWEPIHHLSAGQRTAVALAVFFTLHLSLPTVPQFVLLDEPVVNMDDLNILGLIDFLKELVIKEKIQIIFTTASSSVASLIRRKFSFLKEDYKAFKLTRLQNDKVRIKVVTYLPDKESGNVLSFEAL